jgi:hypothetical protein
MFAALLLLTATACAGSNSAPPASPGASPAAAPRDSTAPAPDTTRARRAAVEIPTPPDSVLVDLLTRGNLVLLFRHAATDWGQRDADAVDFTDRATQRNLSAIGRAQADSIGKAVKALGLKIGRVYASPMWRCRDTAEIAFGRADTTIHLFVKSRESTTVRMKWLSTPITDGTLLVLAAHQDPFIPLMRIPRDQLKEGDAFLILPQAGATNAGAPWKILAQMAPADWTRLAARYGR